ncbi:hypothetical protein Celaphus_00014971, partial [Cervus elaphus hippelaphus]
METLTTHDSTFKLFNSLTLLALGRDWNLLYRGVSLRDVCTDLVPQLWITLQVTVAS